MKLIRLFLGFVVVSFIAGVGMAFNGQNVTSPNKTKEIENVEHEQEKSTFQQEAGSKENQNEETLDKTDIQEPKNVIETQKQEDNKTFSQTDSNTKNSKASNSQNEPKQSSNPKPEVKVEPEKPKTLTKWEELGITEWEYYNKPDKNWQVVTHPNMEQCRAAGNLATDIKFDENGIAYQDYEQY